MQSSFLSQQLILSKTKQQSLSQVTKLNLWGLNLQNIDVLAQLTNLQILSLSINRIKSLEPLSQLHKLKELYLRKNSIENFQEISHLQNLKDLKILWLNENPIEREEFYREKVIKILPHLKKLDNKAVTSEEVQFALSLLDSEEQNKLSRSQQRKVPEIFTQDNNKSSKDKDSSVNNAWMNKKEHTPKTQKKDNSQKKEFIVEFDSQSQKINRQNILEDSKHKQPIEYCRDKERKRNSNLLTAIMILVEELSFFEKQILKQELEKKINQQ